jgi:hypothetical protein
MPILSDIPIDLSPEQIIDSRSRGRTSPHLLLDAREAIALGQTLWEPRAVYDWFQVHPVDKNKVTLYSSNGNKRESTLQIGPRVDLLSGAELALACVVSIGPALEMRVRELNAKREGLKAYMLDSAGVVALGTIGEAIRCLAEDTAQEKGWGVGAALSPGSLVGWPLRGQRDLCSLLALDSIGVELNSHSVLEPHKSASTVIGLGPGYTSIKVGSVCKYCALSKTCWRRREDPQ